MMETLIAKGLPFFKQFGGAVAVAVVCAIVYSLARRALRLVQARGALAPPVVSLLRMLLRWTFVLLLTFLLLSAFGVLENFWAALLAVLAMIAVGFVAVWSVLSNAFCTLLLLIYKPFQVGDHIVIPTDNLEGEVMDLNLMFTTLSCGEDEILQIPNNQFFQKPIRRMRGKKRSDLYEQLTKSTDH